MNRDIRRPEFSHARKSVAAQGGERVTTILSLALFATALWWAIFHWGGLALGFEGDAEWLAPALAAIFTLLMLGLSSSASASDGKEPALGLGHVREVAKKHHSWHNLSAYRVNPRISRLGGNSP
jgi:hypothetical protein